MALRRNSDLQDIEAEEILTKQVLFQTTILFFLSPSPFFFSGSSFPLTRSCHFQPIYLFLVKKVQAI